MIPQKTTIQEAYKNASEIIRSFILSPELASVFGSIRNVYKIHLDDAEKLSLSINSALLGLTSIENFPSLIKEALPNQPEQERTEILKKINEEVFSVLREKEEEKISKIDLAENSLEETSVNERSSPIASPGKLEVETNSNAEEFEIKEDEPEEKTTYRSSPDPYREPID